MFTLRKIDLHPKPAEWYSNYLTSQQWKALRVRVLYERGTSCEKCGQLAEHLHHKTYARLFNELLGDVVLLCKDCHSAAHAKHDIPFLYLIYEDDLNYVKNLLPSLKGYPTITTPQNRKQT